MHEFFLLFGKASVVALISFTVHFTLLFFDICYRYYWKKASEDFKKEDKNFATVSQLKEAAKISSCTTLSLYFCLFIGSLRRAFTDAGSFDITQMWWHSLASVIDIVFLVTILCYLANISAVDIGFPFTTRPNTQSTPTNNDNNSIMSYIYALKPNRSYLLQRVTIAILIAAGTHTLTPLLFYIFGMFDSMDLADYSYQAWYTILYCFIVQQICFLVNGIDEESHWRGYMRALWDRSEFGLWTLYISTGWNYAMVHSLNGGLDDGIGSYIMSVFNVICEGACWMYLYRSNLHENKGGDLPGNWLLHDIDDLFSIWFSGGSTLAGYTLPCGTIATYTISTKNNVGGILTGGGFGIAGSFVYFFQNLYTVGVIYFIRYAMKENSSQENEYKSLQHN